jgi:hypothetical protein
MGRNIKKIGISLVVTFVSMMMLSSISVFASQDNKRIEWNINKSQGDEKNSLSVVLPRDQVLKVQVFFSKHSPDSVILVANVKKLPSENEYFDAVTLVMRYFLKTYKIGKIEKREVVLLLNLNNDQLPLYHIATNQLKLLNNRDFGSKDMLAFEKSVVYPLKTILKRGKFTKEQKDEKSLTKRYQKFLDNYKMPGIIEGTIEAWFAKKKLK